MKIILNALAFFIILSVAGCDISSTTTSASTCTKDAEFIHYLSSEWDKKWASKYEKTLEEGNYCITWSGQSSEVQTWISEKTRQYLESRKPPIGSVFASPQRLAELRQALQSADVPFVTGLYEGAEWLRWDTENDQKARTVVKATWGHDLKSDTRTDLGAIQEAQKSWPIDEKKALNIVLKKHPEILAKARTHGPWASRFTSEPVDGFEDTGGYFWSVQIQCNSGGVHAVFFVHPHTGKIFTITAPNQKGSVECT